jgi:hypothetical protein
LEVQDRGARFRAILTTHEGKAFTDEFESSRDGKPENAAFHVWVKYSATREPPEKQDYSQDVAGFKFQGVTYRLDPEQDEYRAEDPPKGSMHFIVELPSLGVYEVTVRAPNWADFPEGDRFLGHGLEDTPQKAMKAAMQDYANKVLRIASLFLVHASKVHTCSRTPDGFPIGDSPIWSIE